MPFTAAESIAAFVNKSLTVPATTITLADILGPISAVEMAPVKGIFCEPIIRYCRNPATGAYDKIIQITNAQAATYDPSYVIGLTGTTAEMAWHRAHVLWQAYRQVEQAPSDMTDCPSIVRDEDAVARLDTWFSWMGAINATGTIAGISFEPKRRVSFTVPYAIGRLWFLTQHHRLQLPHQTDDQAIEFMIERYRKRLAHGDEHVEVQVVLYGSSAEIEMYIRDTWVNGTELLDWQDHYSTQTQRGEGGADIQDIT